MGKSKHYLLSFTTLFLTKKGYVLMFNQHQNAQNSNNFPLAFETWNRYDALALRDMKKGTKVRQVARRVDKVKDVTIATEGDTPIELHKSSRRYLEGVREVLNDSLLGSLDGVQDDLNAVELHKRLAEIAKGQIPKVFLSTYLLPDLEIPIKVMENGKDISSIEGYEMPAVGEQVRQELVTLLAKLGQEDAMESLMLLGQSGHNQAAELADTIFKDAEKSTEERLLKLQHGARVLDVIKADFLKQVVESLLRKSEEGRIIEVTKESEKDVLESPVMTFISMGFLDEYPNPSSKMVGAEVLDISATNMPEHISYGVESNEVTSTNIKSDSRNEVIKPDSGTSVKGESRNQLSLSETATKADEHTVGLKGKMETFRHLQEGGQPEDVDKVEVVNHTDRVNTEIEESRINPTPHEGEVVYGIEGRNGGTGGREGVNEKQERGGTILQSHGEDEGEGGTKFTEPREDVSKFSEGVSHTGTRKEETGSFGKSYKQSEGAKEGIDAYAFVESENHGGKTEQVAIVSEGVKEDLKETDIFYEGRDIVPGLTEVIYLDKVGEIRGAVKALLEVYYEAESTEKEISKLIGKGEIDGYGEGSTVIEGLNEEVDSYNRIQVSVTARDLTARKVEGHEGEIQDASQGVRTIKGRLPDPLDEGDEVRKHEGVIAERPVEVRGYREGKEQTLPTEVSKVTTGDLGQSIVTDRGHLQGDKRSQLEFYRSIQIPSLLDTFEKTATPAYNYGDLNLTAKAIKQLVANVHEYEGGKGVKDSVNVGYDTSEGIAPNYGNLTKYEKVDLASKQADVREYAHANTNPYEGAIEHLDGADFKTIYLGVLTLLTDWGESTQAETTMNLLDGAEYRRIIQANVAEVGFGKSLLQGNEVLQATEGKYVTVYFSDLAQGESSTGGVREGDVDTTERMYQGDNNAPEVELHWTEGGAHDSQVDVEREKVEGFLQVPSELEVTEEGNDLGKRVTSTLDTETTRVSYTEKKEKSVDLTFYGSDAGEKVEKELEVSREVGDSSRKNDTTHDVDTSRLEVFDILDPVLELYSTYHTNAGKPQVVFDVSEEKVATSHKPEPNLEIAYDMQEVVNRVDKSQPTILDLSDKASKTSNELDISVEFADYGDTDEQLDVYVDKATDTAEVSSDYGVENVDSNTAYKETTQEVNVGVQDNATVDNTHEVGLGGVEMSTDKMEHETALATWELADLDNEQGISLADSDDATLERIEDVSINHTSAGNKTRHLDVEVDSRGVAESKSDADVLIGKPETASYEDTYDVITDEGVKGENGSLEDILLEGGETARQENTKVVEVSGWEVAQTHGEEQLILQGYEKAITNVDEDIVVDIPEYGSTGGTSTDFDLVWVDFADVKNPQDVTVSGAEFGGHSVTETTVLEHTETAITGTEKDVVVERDLQATGQTDYDVHNVGQERAYGAGEFETHLEEGIGANAEQKAELYEEVVDLGTGDGTTDTVVEWHDFATGDHTTDVTVEKSGRGKTESSVDLAVESPEYGGQETTRDVTNETPELADAGQEVETTTESTDTAETGNERDIVVELPTLADGGENRDVVLEAPTLAKSETVVEILSDKGDLAESKNTSDVVIETGETSHSSQEVHVIIESPDLADSSTTTDVTIEGADLADSSNTSDASVENAALADSRNGYEIEVEGTDLADSSITTDVSIEEPDLAEPSNTFMDVIEEGFDSAGRGRNRKLTIIGEGLGDKVRDTLVDLISEEESNRALDKDLEITDEETANKDSKSEMQILEEEQTEKKVHALLDIFEEGDVNKGGSTIIEVGEDEQVVPVTDSYITIEDDELSDKQTAKIAKVEDDDLGDAVSTNAIVINEDDNAERIKVLNGTVEVEDEGYRERVFDVGVEGEEEGHRPDREFPIDINEDDTGVGKLPVDPPWEEPETKGKMWLIMGKQYPAWNNWNPKKTR